MEKKFLVYLLLTVFSLSFIFAADSAGSDGKLSGWKAGVSRTRITPEQSMWMAGYGSRNHPSEGTLQDLWAKAIVLEDSDGKRVVIISTDLLGFKKEMSDRIKKRVERKYGLSKAQILLNSSHTHSGPVLLDELAEIYPLNSDQLLKIKDYSFKLEEKIVTLVGDAFRNMQPVNLFSQNGVARIQVNRRNNAESKLSQQEELKGPNEYSVPVIKVVNEKGDLTALLFGYACHSTTLDIYQFSGDYPGFAQVELEKSHPGVTALFFQGAGGDQNPLPRRTVALARQHGRTLAFAVERVLEEEMISLPAKLSAAYSEVKLQIAVLPAKEDLIKIENDSSKYTYYHRRWAKNMINKIDKGELLDYVFLPLQVIKIGNQPVIALGGEPVIEYAILLKKIFGQNIFVFGFSNVLTSYIPSSTVLAEGGYEGESSQIVHGLPGKYSADVQEVVIREIEKLAEQAGVQKK